MQKTTTTEKPVHKSAPASHHPLKEGQPYDKRELRERIAACEATLTVELARLQAITPPPTSTPQADTIAASLAALKTMLPENDAVISEVSAAELNRWLEEAPTVLDDKSRRARHEQK